jgi:hypothetical protein
VAVDETTFITFRDTVMDRIHRDLRVPPEAVRLELHPHSRGQEELATVSLALKQDALPNPAEYPELLANARSIVEDEIEYHGLPFALAA